MRKNLKTCTAISMENGIKFYSKKHKNYFSIATINDKGKIITKWQDDEEKNNPQEKEKSRNTLLVVLIMLPVIISFSILIELLDKNNPILLLRLCIIIIPILMLGIFFLITF